MKDETGKMYGYLHVERAATKEEAPRADRAGVYWNCTCTKCGRKNVIVFGDYLRNGDTKSCGCIISVNESKIADLLNQRGIKYQTQYKFSDLRVSKTGPEFMFDFAIMGDDNTLLYIIEYDGQQHFNASHAWEPEGFLTTRRNDFIKNEYCFSHGIPLIRIPYDMEYNIQDLSLETTRFLLTPDSVEDYYNRD